MFLKFPIVYLCSIMKDNIRIKATELFLEHGFKSITMDDIANEMGMSKKTIYGEYANKIALIEDCVTGKFDELKNGIDDICTLGKNPIEELYEIKKYVMFHLKDEKSSPQYQLSKYYPTIFKKIKELHFNKMHSCVLANVEKGISQEIYRPNLNSEFVARIYFSGVDSIKDHKMFPVDRFPMIHLMDMFLEYHLRGIVTPKGRKILNEIINSNHE